MPKNACMYTVNKDTLINKYMTLDVSNIMKYVNPAENSDQLDCGTAEHPKLMDYTLYNT